MPDAFLADLTDFTLSSWIYLRSDAANQLLFLSAVSRERYLSVNLRSSRADNQVRVASAPVGFRSEDALNGTKPFPIGRWAHLAVTLQNGQAILYIDGEKVGSGPAMGRLTLADLGKTTENWIGRSNEPGQHALDAMPEDFRIHRGAMTAEEIAKLAVP